MATSSLSKLSSSGAVMLRVIIGKLDALRYLPRRANAFIRFDADGNLVADDNQWHYKTAAYTAKAGDRIAANTTSAAFSITLPAAATAGDMIEIADAALTFDTNNLTIARNSHNIDSAGSNLVLSAERARIVLIYINETIGWRTYYSNGVATALSISGAFAVAGVTTLAAVSATTGAFSGIVTFSERIRLATVAAPVAATGAGGGVAGAAQLGNANEVFVSSDGATKGVKLPAGAVGDVVTIHNTSGTALNLFAASGGTINGGSADAGCTIPASKGVRAHCSATNTWTVYDLPARAGAAA